MANRNFNKQVVPARKKLAAGGTSSPRKPRSFDNTDTTPRPKSFNNTDTTDREKIIRDRILNNKLKDRAAPWENPPIINFLFWSNDKDSIKSSIASIDLLRPS